MAPSPIVLASADESSRFLPVLLDSGCTSSVTSDPSLVVPGSIERCPPVPCSLAGGFETTLTKRCRVRLPLKTTLNKVIVVEVGAYFFDQRCSTLISLVHLQFARNWDDTDFGGHRKINGHYNSALSFSSREFGTVICQSVGHLERPSLYHVPVERAHRAVLQESDRHYLNVAASVATLNGSPLIQRTKMEWHEIFGHPSDASFELQLATVPATYIIPLPGDSSFSRKKNCPVCQATTAPRKRLKSRTHELSTRPLQVLHVDVCFPVGMPSTAAAHGAIGIEGTTAVLVIVDDYSRYYMVVPLQGKYNVTEALISTIQLLENRFSDKGFTVTQVRTDNGTEFKNVAVQLQLKHRSVEFLTTAPYTPAQNGIAERAVGSLVKRANRLLVSSQLPASFWFFAIKHAATLLNQLPRTAQHVEGKFIACERFYRRVVPVSALHAFGSDIMVFPDTPSKVPKILRTGYRYTYLGVDDSTDNVSKLLIYRPSDTQLSEVPITVVNPVPVTFTVAQRINQVMQHLWSLYKSDKDTVRHGFSFRQLTATYTSKFSTESTENPLQLNRFQLTPVVFPLVASSIGDHLPLRAWSYHVSPYVHDISVFLNLAVGDRGADKRNIEPDIPQNAKTAFGHPQWKAAMDVEFGRLIKLGTFVSTNVQPTRSTFRVGCRWVFALKPLDEGYLYKARLVAQGFSQKPGLHYFDTYAPVLSKSQVRTLVAMALRLGMTIHQMDVTTAFLYGDIDVPDLYLKPVPMYENYSSGMLLLKKALYGLKQSPRLWYQKLTTALVKAGYREDKNNQCIYWKKVDNGVRILGVYVDDILVLSKPDDIVAAKQELSSMGFDMKDLGLLKRFIGIEFDWSVKSVKMHQTAQICKMLNTLRTQWSDSKLDHIWKRLKKTPGIFTPLDIPINSKWLSEYKHTQPPSKPDPFLVNLMYSTVGSIRYLADCTRPDVAAAAMYLSTMMHQPREVDLTMALGTLCYLCGTKELGIEYPIVKSKNSKEFSFSMMSDASWKTTMKARSVSGHIIMLDECLVDWKSAQQKNVSLSAAESEFQAMTFGARDAIELKELIEPIASYCNCTVNSKIDIKTDNKAVITSLQAENPRRTVLRSSIYYYWIKDYLNKEGAESMSISYVGTKSNTADFLTKGLNGLQFKGHRRSLMTELKSNRDKVFAKMFALPATRDYLRSR